jgi:hypothetical protein
VDVALEIGIAGEQLRLSDQGFMGTALHDPPLVECEGAEGTAAETPPVTDEAEPDLLEGGDLFAV